MKRITGPLAMILLALMALMGCDRGNDFVVRGQLQGLGSQLLTLTYYVDGGMKQTVTGSQEGKFSIRGVSAQPTLAILYLGNSKPLATMIVRNGDEITLRGNVAEPYSLEITGNTDTEEISDWTNDNAETLSSLNAERINRSITDYVTRNKSRMASTALLVTHFRSEGYERLADSLLSMISSSARPMAIVQNYGSVLAGSLSATTLDRLPTMTLYSRRDSNITFLPTRSRASVLVFTGGERAGRDTILPALTTLSKQLPQRRSLTIVELSLAPDSAQWRRSIERDSVKWEQTWAPGSAASSTVGRFAIPVLPYFIVADSLGVPRYRGTSTTRAVAMARELNSI